MILPFSTTSIAIASAPAGSWQCRFFARNIAIVQGDQLLRLHTHRQAVAWNKGLPCGGTIRSLKQRGSSVEVTFHLESAKNRHCEDPAGAEAIAIVVVEDGRIILWDQIGSQIRLGH